jgi:type IV secretory pathway TraG/TraD family ATPase VirD4
MAEFLSEVLSLALAGAIIGFFAMIAFVVGMALWMYFTGRGGIRRRPDCYGTHEYKPANAVLFNCDGCAYQRECWK